MSNPTDNAWEKLKACPCCGPKGNPQFLTLDGPTHSRDDTHYPKHAVACHDSGCGIQTLWFELKKEARKSWNTRVPDAPSEGELVSPKLIRKIARRITTLNLNDPSLEHEIVTVLRDELNNPQTPERNPRP